MEAVTMGISTPTLSDVIWGPRVKLSCASLEFEISSLQNND